MILPTTNGKVVESAFILCWLLSDLNHRFSALICGFFFDACSEAAYYAVGDDSLLIFRCFLL